MKLADIVPHLTPEEMANVDIKIAVNWENQIAALFVVDQNNVIITERKLKTTTAPTEPELKTQGDFWIRHHNPWLD